MVQLIRNERIKIKKNSSVSQDKSWDEELKSTTHVLSQYNN